MATGDRIEAFVNMSDLPCGWYTGSVKSKKTPVAMINWEHDFGLDNLVDLKSCRIYQEPKPVGEFMEVSTLNLKVNAELILWAQGEDKWYKDLVEKTKICGARFDPELEAVVLTGVKKKLEFARKLVEFKFKNMEEVVKLEHNKDKLKVEHEKLAKKITTQTKETFDVPSEIVGLLVGNGYKKIKELQTKYKVAIKVRDIDERKVTEITVSGDNQESVHEVKSMLHIFKEEYTVESSKVSFIIGKQGVRIRDILEKANLLKIDFDQDNQKGNKVLFL